MLSVVAGVFCSLITCTSYGSVVFMFAPRGNCTFIGATQIYHHLYHINSFLAVRAQMQGRYGVVGCAAAISNFLTAHEQNHPDFGRHRNNSCDRV